MSLSDRAMRLLRRLTNSLRSQPFLPILVTVLIIATVAIVIVQTRGVEPSGTRATRTVLPLSLIHI